MNVACVPYLRHRANDRSAAAFAYLARTHTLRLRQAPPPLLLCAACAVWSVMGRRATVVAPGVTILIDMAAR